MFYNEIEILDIRLNELNPYVDYFVIVEAKETHSGLKRELVFEMYKHLFDRYVDKIIYIAMDSLTNPEIKLAEAKDEELDFKIKKRMPNFIRKRREHIWSLFTFFRTLYNLLNKRGSKSINVISNRRVRKIIGIMDPNKKRNPPSMMRENLQRNGIVKALKNANNDDIILISDLDEIPRGNLISSFKNVKEPVVFEQNLYAYYINRIIGRKWIGTVLIKKMWLKNKTPQYYRNLRNNFKKVSDGGWHFSFMGGNEKLIKKLESFWHFDEKRFTKKKTKKNLEKKISKDTKIVKIDESYPECIHEMINKYPYLIFE